VQIRISDIQDRLRGYIRELMREHWGRGTGLAEESAIPQGHLSNFLNGRRGLSVQAMDRLLTALDIGVEDLVKSSQSEQSFVRLAVRSRYAVLPRISPTVALQPRLYKDGILGLDCIDKQFLKRRRSNDVAGRSHWDRFVLLDSTPGSVRAILPAANTTTLLVDRHYTSLEPYLQSRSNLYVVQLTTELVVGRVNLACDHLLVRPCDLHCDLLSIQLPRGTQYYTRIVGRVCRYYAEA
jgi:transcriptional regulator with XRE-family HTH domain